MRTVLRIFTVLAFVLLGIRVFAATPEPNQPATSPKPAKAFVISCKDMIDDGLYQSIKRRTEQALEAGATYVIYDIGTYGGRVDSADNISKYLIHEVSRKAHTVAYVTTEAISAGSWISVSCNDIIMKENTKIGDCAPISMEGKIEGVEREKQESYIRASFRACGEVNHYPIPILQAMVTQQIEVYRLKNIETGELAFFDGEQMPKDANEWDLKNKKLIDSKDTLITLTASEAKNYGVARTLVKDVSGVLAFFEQRDNVTFLGDTTVIETNWSEELVRWLNAPAVTSILFMVGLLGLYMEFNTPGVFIPGLVAGLAFAILFGSKYLIGLASYVEIILFLVGLILVILELFILPSFGIAGVLGIVLMVAGLLGMFLPNRPGEFPWPRFDYEWDIFRSGLISLGIGFIGFVVVAMFIARYLPKTRLFAAFVLAPPGPRTQEDVNMTAPPEQSVELKVGDDGEVLSPLRPSGRARFGSAVVDVVAQAEFLGKGDKVKIVAIHGNRVVVKAS
jgi:membrane-bound serine protease (ClpP class)